MPRSVKHPRSLACTRCFRLKRKCDHAKPICGECRRRGAECLPAKSCKEGEMVTVPVKYLRDLEARIAELEHGSRTSMTAPQARDIGIQTEPMDVLPYNCPHINNDNDDNTSLALSDFLDFDPQRKTPDSNTPAITMAPDQLLNQVKSSESRLISFPSSRLQMPSLGDFINPRSSDGLCLMDTGVDNSKPTDVESLHDLGMVGGYSFWLEEAYTNLYFSISHFVWPLLDCNAWSSWRHDWNLDKQTELWKGFFVQMVYAIGSLSCSILQPGQNHSDRAAEIYASALSYYPHVMAEESAVLQIQASILMILYSLHCPSSGEISMSVSSIVPFCSATLAELQKRISSGCDSTTRSVVGPHIPLTESMFITCYMLNEIIVSGWERPVSEAYRIVDDDIHMLSNEIPDASSTSAALRHLFRLRKIQANIRRYWDGPPDCQDSDDTSFKLALDAWRKDIPRYSVEEARSTHLHPLWMTNLYDYSVIILMQGKRKNLEHEEIDAILSAGIEVCLNYRRMQEEGQVMCFTWSTLVFQFRTGILLLYICRLATLDLDTIQRTFDAVCACADSLTCFVSRWQDATPYAEVFYFLLHSASWILDDLPSRLRCAYSFDELKTHLETLKKQYLHKEVLEMIEDMVYPAIYNLC